MSFRGRKDRGPPAGSEEQQLWQSVRDYLRSIEKLQETQVRELPGVESARRLFLEAKDARASGSEGGEEASQDDLVAQYRRLDKIYEDEQRDIVKALEKLEVLIAVRDDSSNDPVAKRKKRKVEGGGTASSSPPTATTTLKDRGPSPVTTRDELSSVSLISNTSVPEKEKKRSNSKSYTSAAAPPLTHRRSTLSSAKDAGTPGSSIASQSAASTGAGKDGSKETAANGPGSAYVDPARARREVLADQLPLQKGRKVAFRQPSKNKVGPGAANVSNMTSRSASNAAAAAAASTSSSASGSNSTGGGAGHSSSSATTGNGSSSTSASAAGSTAVPDDEGETWIMATIIECINNDRNRYVVQDAEDTAMPTYNTTLKAIVPLPESVSTLPLEDYKVGMQVMGLYPDTSCFYQAIVRGGGPGLNGKVTAKMQRKQDELLNTAYRLEFEDDGGAIQNVPACLVVERP